MLVKPLPSLLRGLCLSEWRRTGIPGVIASLGASCKMKYSTEEWPAILRDRGIGAEDPNNAKVIQLNLLSISRSCSNASEIVTLILTTTNKRNLLKDFVVKGHCRGTVTLMLRNMRWIEKSSLDSLYFKKKRRGIWLLDKESNSVKASTVLHSYSLAAKSG
ncbi:hypothetical protein BT96DRAFT_946993 [Gymnopus androsaceus JB14]|uniref:Uncharacterized protein n=1 Tax=Gymnopus androsaceus JB14 TaxID=1447944 RepID=A0A6A4GW25_9AGAR|nr:hypothetical protein BT96DRAFT_946993 [Gymnopus androsaceus JB14]